MATKYYCDRCNEHVYTRDSMHYIEIHECEEKNAYGMTKMGEFCEQCLRDIKAFIRTNPKESNQ